MRVPPEVEPFAFEAAFAYRERTKGPKIKPTHVTVFCLPEENEITGELVLKVHGTASEFQTVRKPKRERFDGLFVDSEENETVELIQLGTDWCLVYEQDLPEWAVRRVIETSWEKAVA